MIKIRAMGVRELKQVLNLLERFTDEDFEYRVLENFQQLYAPIQRFSQMLPPQWQFIPAIYVAVSNGKVLGLIWLSKDGHKASRWKIEQLIIDPDEFSYDVGTQLINYVINRYGAEGVQTFLALVHNRYEQALSLLKSCGFRHVSRLHVFVHEHPSSLAVQEAPIGSLRESDGGDRYKLKALHDESLPIEKRIPLEKNPKDFSSSWLQMFSDRLKGIFHKRWVVEDRANDLFVGSLEITTENYKDFQLNVMVSPGWQDGYEDLLRYGIQHVMQHTENARIHVHAYEFHPEFLETLRDLNFQRVYEAELLVKDYWVPLGDKPEKRTSPILLFAGKPSTAWNSLRQTTGSRSAL